VYFWIVHFKVTIGGYGRPTRGDRATRGVSERTPLGRPLGRASPPTGAAPRPTVTEGVPQCAESPATVGHDFAPLWHGFATLWHDFATLCSAGCVSHRPYNRGSGSMAARRGRSPGPTLSATSAEARGRLARHGARRSVGPAPPTLAAARRTSYLAASARDASNLILACSRCPGPSASLTRCAHSGGGVPR
jgi:hypothetical protein